MKRPRPDAILLRHDERCRGCKYEYYAWAWFDGGNWIAACAGVECEESRANLDTATYGERLNLPEIEWKSRETSRFEQSKGQKKVTLGVAGGTCVHCVLEAAKISRRGAVPIPRTWVPVKPTFRPLSLFALEMAGPDLPTIDADSLGGPERDHIFQRQVHEYTVSRLSSAQAVFVRRHWVVPSCPRHNQARAWSLEPLPYLMHLFALFLSAKELTISDATEETHQFVDAAKAIHEILREQALETIAQRDSPSPSNLDR